jgi:D-alanine--D-alanine ligase
MVYNSGMQKKANTKGGKLKVALVCGGPSLERGISLNSARSVLDHLEDDNIQIIPFYINPEKKIYTVSRAQLYSNTPSDFDFKLHTSGKLLSQNDFIKNLKKADIAFPVIHGEMGEDGQLQKIFEDNNIPYIAPPAEACKIAFNKFYTNEFLAEKGFYTLPSILINKKDTHQKENIDNFWKENKLNKSIVKPATGGSSIGVAVANSPKDALEKMEEIFHKGIDTSVVIEPFAKGIEFTSIVLEGRGGNAVALVPTEIDISYDNGSVFDYRKKYLPTSGTMYHNPARFTTKQIKDIQKKAETIFTMLGMKDFARLDGWLLDNGEIWFSDINPVAGMEQNSFLFQQAARIGFSHRDLLRYIVGNACKRYKIPFPKMKVDSKKRKNVNVIFGGPSSERQVSLMSGTNICLKLKKSHIYKPHPFILDLDLNVWELPYSFALNHTVEEVLYTAKNAKSIYKKLQPLQNKIHKKLGIQNGDIHEPFFMPRKYTLKDFIKKSQFVFLGLHGNPGEDGTIQAMLEKAGVKYNGPSAATSMLCMDKYDTARVVNNLNIKGIKSANQIVLNVKDINDYKKVWIDLKDKLKANTIIVKPRGDGCSSGIFRLYDADDLAKYVSFVKKNAPHVPAGTFLNQKDIVDMPTSKVSELLFENFIETDTIRTNGTKLVHGKKTGWVEVTVGVYTKGNKLQVMNPSITVAEGEVLSVEEKFQGGTGVNITPPPENIISKKVLSLIKDRIGIVAKALGIVGYSRIDAFVNVKTGEVSIIEANTLPGLTPSTVIYHQALAESVPMYPTTFLEQLIKNKGY